MWYPLVDTLHPFVDTLEKVKTVYKISHAISVDTSHRKITAVFKLNWISMMTTYGMNMPLKVHIISEHLSEYFEMTGKTQIRWWSQPITKSRHFLKLDQTTITKKRNLSDLVMQLCQVLSILTPSIFNLLIKWLWILYF